MSLIFLSLGEITFANTEIPETINFGGDQALSVKQLVGGQRVIDSMGRVDDDIRWSGLFFGETALFRAQYLDGLRQAGAPLPLSWGIFNYLVVIKSFNPRFERNYQIPYSITLTIIQDLNFPIDILLPVGYNDVIENQIIMARDIANVAENGSVIDAIEELEDALSSIPSLSSASSQTINSLFPSVVNAISTTDGAIVEETGAIQSTSLDIGIDVIVTEPLPNVVADATLKLSQFYQIEAILINLQTNLLLIQRGSQGKTVTLQNPNLYRLAAQYYGDATQWTTIAIANGLVDPFASGGTISSVIVLNGGSNYVNPLPLALGNYTYQANLKSNVVDGVIASVRVITGGLFYTKPEIVFFEASEGSGAVAVAVCSQTLTIPANVSKNTGGIYTT